MQAPLKRVMRSLRNAVRAWRDTHPAARVVLIKLWARLWRSGARGPAFGAVPSSPRLLFVCHGNILRSALAAALARQLVAEGRLASHTGVESVGLRAGAGAPADPRGILAARELGLDLADHRATPITAEAVDRADLILVMDRVNAAELLARFPSAEPRTYLLGVFPVGAGHPAEILDPYSGDDEAVRQAFRRVEAAVRGLAAHLSARPAPPLR